MASNAKEMLDEHFLKIRKKRNECLDHYPATSFVMTGSNRILCAKWTQSRLYIWYFQTILMKLFIEIPPLWWFSKSIDTSFVFVFPTELNLLFINFYVPQQLRKEISRKWHLPILVNKTKMVIHRSMESIRFKQKMTDAAMMRPSQSNILNKIQRMRQSIHQIRS